MTDINSALSALNHLDAGCSREEWVRIGMAAKSADLSFEDFHNWSKTAPNYAGEKDCKSVWKSFDESGGGITAATLFGLALAKSWQDPARMRTNTIHCNSNYQNGRTSHCDKHVVTNTRALDIWERCLPALPSHEYILRKQGKPNGLRYYPSSEPPLIINGKNVTNYLVVPCWSNNELQTLQFISPNKGDKKINLTGASFNDGCFTFGVITNLIYICEGIGQVWAVNKASGHSAVVCFGAGRMLAVSKILRAKYPIAHLVVVPDSGKEKLAAEIAATVAGQWVEMPQNKPPNYDANDYAQEFGSNALSVLLEQAKAPEMRFKLLSGADLLNAAPMRWILRGVLPAEGLAALYGPSMSGKSFLVLDMACAIATGVERWYGFRVTQSPVTYVCLEGEAGIGKRIKAWNQHFNRTIPDSLKFVIQPFNLLTSDVNDLAKAIIAMNKAGGLVILDTLNRAAPGADENSPVDTGKIIAAASKLQKIIGGIVLLVHHTGKDETKGLRAHSSLLAALDASIKLIHAANHREWKVEKSKDDESGKSHPFKLKVIKVGIDEYGEDITSCVVVPDESIDSGMRRILPPKSGNQKIIWDALQNLFYLSEDVGQGGAPATRPCIRLEDAIAKTKGHLVVDLKRQTERAQDAIKGLVSKGVLDHRDGWLWMV